MELALTDRYLKDMEMLIEKAAQAAPAQTIRIEQAPLSIAPVVPPKKA